MTLLLIPECRGLFWQWQQESISWFDWALSLVSWLKWASFHLWWIQMGRLAILCSHVLFDSLLSEGKSMTLLTPWIYCIWPHYRYSSSIPKARLALSLHPCDSFLLEPQRLPFHLSCIVSILPLLTPHRLNLTSWVPQFFHRLSSPIFVPISIWHWLLI